VDFPPTGPKFVVGFASKKRLGPPLRFMPMQTAVEQFEKESHTFATTGNKMNTETLCVFMRACMHEV